MIALLVASLLIPSAQATPKNSVRNDDALYNRLYPTHLEYCSGTTLQFIDGVTGGIGGHGFSYVHGLCKDMSKAYPQVKVCDGSELESGVGVSVNSDFLNVNWVAVPTRSLLIDGDLQEGESVTRAVVDRVAERARELRVFEGIVIKPELTKDAAGHALVPGSAEYLHAVAVNSEGTDLGVRLARNLQCVRVPFQRERLGAIAEALNALNDSYYKTGKVYTWSGMLDNCAHVATLIMAKAGVRDAIPVGSYANLAIPRNGSYTLVQDGILRSIRPADVYARKSDRALIESPSPWMPTQVGVLTANLSAFLDNSVFEISNKALWIFPATGQNFAAARAAFSRPKREYSDIRANLKLWERKYSEALEEARSKNSFFASDAYVAFKTDYAQYLEAQLETVRRSLNGLGLKP